MNLTHWMYEAIYSFSRPGWERETVPSQVVTLGEIMKGEGCILDLGCGSGLSAVFLALKGYQVTGVDFSHKAITLAKRRAQQAKVVLELQRKDATQLEFLHLPFDAVLDIGCFHGLDAAGKGQYIAHLKRLTLPGSAFLLWALDSPSHFGIGLRRAEAIRLFTPEFKLTRIDEETVNGRKASWYWYSRKVV